jgi:hypothetical protein
MSVGKERETSEVNYCKSEELEFQFFLCVKLLIITLIINKRKLSQVLKYILHMHCTVRSAEDETGLGTFLR